MIEDKLINIQSELKAPKSQRNKFGNYNYRSCEDILEAVKPLLLKNQAILTISDELVLIGDRYYIKATATLRDKENSISNTAYARESLEKKGMDDSQITGTASSYARKYALNGLFCIDDTKDADTNEYKEQIENKTTANKNNDKEDNIDNKTISQTFVEAFKSWIQNHKIASDVVFNTLNEFGYKDIKDIKNKDYKAIVNKLNNMIQEEK